MVAQMGYEARITRDRPGCILFLIDNSASMRDTFEHDTSRVAFLTDALNRTLTELAAACRRTDGTRHYFDVGVITYGDGKVQPALGGSLAGRPLVSITDLAASPLRVERRRRKEPDGAGGIIEVEVPFPIFFETTPNGMTPMCEGFRYAARIVADWCESRPASFPPIVMHISDGDATDGEPSDVEATARKLTEQQTRDGYALLINLHIAGGARPICFPSSSESLPIHPYARALFQASPMLPPPLLARCFKRGMQVQPGSRGYIYNGAMEDVVTVFDIGTASAMERTGAITAER